jgi:hypothetical protein
VVYLSNPTNGDSVYLYYGNNDTSIGLAKAAISDATATRHDVPAKSTVSDIALTINGKRITYTLPANLGASVDTHIDLYTLSGEKVTSLVNAPHAPGTYQLPVKNLTCAQGLYICRMTAGSCQTAASIVVGRTQ